MAVSSTVIPLGVYEVNSRHAVAADTTEYKMAYMKHLRKKVYTGTDAPADTLITSKIILHFFLNIYLFQFQFSANGKHIEKKLRD